MSLIQNTVNRLRPLFPAEKCGMAGGVRRGELRISGRSALTLDSPPIGRLGRLPYYSPAASAYLLVRELNLAGVEAKTGRVVIHPDGAAPEAEVVHWVVQAEEEGETYLVGLTPFDRLLNIYPFKSASDPQVAPFVEAYLSGQTIFTDPFSGHWRVNVEDSPAWELESPALSVHVLASRMTDRGYLVDTNLALKALEDGQFVFGYGAVAFGYEPTNALLDQVNSVRLATRFGLSQLAALIGKAESSRRDPEAFACAWPWATYKSASQRELRLISSVMRNNWPLVIEFLRKLETPLQVYAASRTVWAGSGQRDGLQN